MRSALRQPQGAGGPPTPSPRRAVEFVRCQTPAARLALGEDEDDGATDAPPDAPPSPADGEGEAPDVPLAAAGHTGPLPAPLRPCLAPERQTRPAFPRSGACCAGLVAARPLRRPRGSPSRGRGQRSGCWGRCFLGLQRRTPGLRWGETVHEFRFERSVDPLLRRLGRKIPRPYSWRATTTTDGTKMADYCHGTSETAWETPVAVEMCAQRFGLAVGDHVEVFSSSAQQWCPGYVEAFRFRESIVSVAFRMPQSRSEEWAKKDLSVDDPSWRRASQDELPAAAASPPAPAPAPPPSAAGAWGAPNELQLPAPAPSSSSTASAARGVLQDTSLPENWTGEERAAYARLYEEALGRGRPRAPDGQPPRGVCGAARLLAFLGTSGLPDRVLQEVLQVGNPELKDPLGREEFFACCRLVGHCQARAAAAGAGAAASGSSGAEAASVLRSGGLRLRTLLRVHWLAAPAPSPPSFGAPAGAAGG
ncbi:unnamed protein product [Prorocentrum cordatum]|uniref:WW domain-containing protein n=1 Tax=Prorocentrum cordatum TaxID=2364126 RepID=A0ABN9T0M2_9DINO|nr:unnamed protein product [Polarella glacialis]